MQTRLNKNVVPFAQDATAGKRYVFGETVASDDINDNINANIIKGWEAGLDANGKPPMAWFNSVMYAATQLVAYLYQNGIAEYEASQEYFTGSVCVKNGTIYVSTLGDATSPNIGNIPSSSSAWDKIDAGYVDGVERNMLGIGGSGYAWVDETANRSIGVTYTNNSGKPIQVSIVTTSAVQHSVVNLEVDGMVVGKSRNPSADGVNSMDTMTAIVPNGSTYVIIEVSGTTGFYEWKELK